MKTQSVYHHWVYSCVKGKRFSVEIKLFSQLDETTLGNLFPFVPLNLKIIYCNKVISWNAAWWSELFALVLCQTHDFSFSTICFHKMFLFYCSFLSILCERIFISFYVLHVHIFAKKREKRCWPKSKIYFRCIRERFNMTAWVCNNFGMHRV